MTTAKDLTELFNSLSIKEKLSFDSTDHNGKRGIVAIRERISSLKAKKNELKNQSLIRHVYGNRGTAGSWYSRNGCEISNHSLEDVLYMREIRTIKGANNLNLAFRCETLGYLETKKSKKDWMDTGTHLVIIDYTESWVQRTRKYGGYEISDRYLKVINKKTHKETKLYVDSFRGNWALNAILRHCSDSKNIYPKAIYLKNGVKAVKVNHKNPQGFTLYKLVLKNGIIWQYCASNGETHFHANSINIAITSLENKINQKKSIEQRQLETQENQMINKELGEKLGFCRSGMSAFAEIINKTIDDNISFKCMKKSLSKADQKELEAYEEELITLARVFGYKDILMTKKA